MSREELSAAVARCHYAADVLRELGFPVGGNGYRALSLRVRRWQLDTSHWQGSRPPAPRPLELALTPGGYGRDTNRTRIKRRLIAAGVLDDRCAICGHGPAWRGQPLVLILDHINGIADDYSRDNLRLVCPNCNSQLETHAGRNRGRYAGDGGRSVRRRGGRNGGPPDG